MEAQLLSEIGAVVHGVVAARAYRMLVCSAVSVGGTEVRVSISPADTGGRRAIPWTWLKLDVCNPGFMDDLDTSVDDLVEFDGYLADKYDRPLSDSYHFGEEMRQWLRSP